MSVPGEGFLRRVRGISAKRSIPADVAAVLVLLVVADVLVLVRGVPTPVRAAFGTTLLFFLPGYGVVTALFPAGSSGRPTARGWPARWRAGSSEATDEEVQPSTDGGDPILEPPGGSSVTGPERVALAVGASLAVLPVIALVLSASGLGFALATEVGALSLVSGGGVLVGWMRRSSLPEHRRFSVHPRARLASIRNAIRRLSPDETAVTALLVVAALLATATLSYALLVPPGSAGYTELSLLTESDDGELVASGYPSEFDRGETREFVSAVENREGHTETYTLVVELQRVRTDGEEPTVVESRTVDRRQVTVDSGERATETVAITPEMEGENLRVIVLLYEEPAPETRNPADAYRYTYIWIDVGTGDASGTEDARSDPAGTDDDEEVPLDGGERLADTSGSHPHGTGPVAGSR